MASCRKVYDDLRVLETSDRSNASAVAMIRKSIQQHTEKVSQARGDEPEMTKASTLEPSNTLAANVIIPPNAQIAPESSSPVTESVSAQSRRKRARDACITEEPWHSLVVSLTKLINGESNVTFPSPLPNMSPSHVHLFEHAVDSLKKYQEQGSAHDVTLLKDVQVAMSCVLNTMCANTQEYFDKVQHPGLFRVAFSLSVIEGFDSHPSVAIAQEYEDCITNRGVKGLLKQLIVDRGILHSKYMDHEDLPSDKVLEILTKLSMSLDASSCCDRLSSFNTESPSENDCLHLWTSVFDVIMDKISLHTGETMLKASKTMRHMQWEEHGDVGDTGRMVDCIFMYKGIELSNIDFKRTDIGLTVPVILPMNVNYPKVRANPKTFVSAPEFVLRTLLLPPQFVPQTSLLPPEFVPRTSLLPPEFVPRTSLPTPQFVPQISLLPSQFIPMSTATTVSTFKFPKPPTYDGTRDGFVLLAWLSALHRFFKGAHVAEDQKTLHAVVFLVGTASLWWEGMGWSDETSYDKFEKALVDEFIPTGFLDHVRHLLVTIQFKTDLPDYVSLVRKYMNILCTGSMLEGARQELEKTARAAFLQGCPEDLRR
ncbi:hypothetical protein BGX27_001801, partial [Mortierella sp. AM989]